MTESERRNKFKKWLIEADGKADATATNYASALSYIQADYKERTGESFSFYACTNVGKLKALRTLYGTGGKYENIGKSRSGAPINAIKRYIEFVQSEELSLPVPILHKKLENTEIYTLTDIKLLKVLFIKNIESLFPGYSVSKKAKDPSDAAFILENEKEKSVLVVLIEPQIARVAMFGELSAKLPGLTELFSKDGISVKGVIIAGKTDSLLEEAVKTNPDIMLKRYDINLILKV